MFSKLVLVTNVALEYMLSVGAKSMTKDIIKTSTQIKTGEKLKRIKCLLKNSPPEYYFLFLGNFFTFSLNAF